MAITFMGYMDHPEEMTSPKRRVLYLCDSASDAANLPTDSGVNGTAAPAPGSMALVAGGGGTKVLLSTGSWGDL